jgi:hypothetical protein
MKKTKKREPVKVPISYVVGIQKIPAYIWYNEELNICSLVDPCFSHKLPNFKNPPGTFAHFDRRIPVDIIIVPRDTPFEAGYEMPMIESKGKRIKKL